MSLLKDNRPALALRIVAMGCLAFAVVAAATAACSTEPIPIDAGLFDDAAIADAKFFDAGGE